MNRGAPLNFLWVRSRSLRTQCNVDAGQLFPAIIRAPKSVRDMAWARRLAIISRVFSDCRFGSDLFVIARLGASGLTWDFESRRRTRSGAGQMSRQNRILRGELLAAGHQRAIAA